MKVVHMGETNPKWTKDCFLLVFGERDPTLKGNESHLEMTYAHYAKELLFFKHNRL